MSIGINHAVTDNGGELMSVGVKFLQAFHELGQFIGLGVGDAILDLIDFLNDQGILPVIQSVGHKAQQFVPLLKNHSKLCMYLAELRHIVCRKVTCQLPDIIIINGA